MNLSEKAINEFKQIYQEEFDVSLSEIEIVEKANSLLNLFKVLLKIPHDLTNQNERGTNEA